MNHNAFDEQLAIISKGFLDAFVFMGGAGTSLCIIIAVFIIMHQLHLLLHLSREHIQISDDAFQDD